MDMRCGLWFCATALVGLGFSQQTPSFEVTSVKPSVGYGSAKSGSKGGTSRIDPTLLSIHNSTLKTLILRSYGLQEYQLFGGPSWIGSDRYDIDARPGQAANREQMMLMLRSLLEDRFQLKMRQETKTMEAYVVTVAKGGPKIGPFFHSIQEGEPFPPDQGRIQMGGSLKNFAFILRSNMRMYDPSEGPIAAREDFPPVLDHTGLTGAYSILVSTETHEGWASILEHQLGLKLGVRKEAVEVWIIEHAAQPSAN